MPQTDLEQLVYSMSADITQLSKQQAKALALVNDNADVIQKRMDKAGSSLFDKWSAPPEIGAAFDKIFDSSRLKLLDSGIARVGLFGSAFEALGGAGVIAAGALGGFAASMDVADKAAENAANIAKTAKEIGVTTDFLQEFNYAASQTDVPVDKADASLKALNVSLGNVQNNLAKAQLVKAFADAGFTPDQLKSFQNAGDLLPVLAQHIRDAGDAAQQASLAKRLGIEDLLPLIQSADGGFASLAEQARNLGIVMDSSLVKQGEEAHQKLVQLDQVMRDKANISFLEFAKTLVAVKTAFADAEAAALSFLAKITGTQSDKSKLSDLQTGLANLQREPDFAKSPVAQGLAARYTTQIAALQASIKSTAAADAAEPKASAYKTPVVPDAKPKTKRNDTAQLSATAQSTLDSAIKNEASALAALTGNILDHATLEKTAVDDETQKLKDAADAEIAKIEADKSLTAAKKVQLVAELQHAKALDDRTGADKKAKIDRDAQDALTAEALAYQTKFNGFALAALQSQSALAKTAEERRTIELQILAIQQKQASDALANQNRLAERQGQTPAQSAGLVAQQQADFAGQIATALKATEGPLAKWRDENLTTAAQVNEAYQTVAVNGLNSVTDSITAAITQTKTWGQAFHDIANQIITDLVRIEVQKDITTPLANLLGGFKIPGFAGGTSFAPGGLSLVGENGPELVKLPAGSSVTPNSQLSLGGGGGLSVGTIHVQVNASGAFDQNTMIQAVRQGTLQAVQMARAAAAGDYARRQRNSFTGRG